MLPRGFALMLALCFLAPLSAAGAVAPGWISKPYVGFASTGIPTAFAAAVLPAACDAPIGAGAVCFPVADLAGAVGTVSARGVSGSKVAFSLTYLLEGGTLSAPLVLICGDMPLGDLSGLKAVVVAISAPHEHALACTLRGVFEGDVWTPDPAGTVTLSWTPAG